jgi:hypothetical protein
MPRLPKPAVEDLTQAEDKEKGNKREAVEFDKWGPLVIEGTHTNSVILTSILDFEFLHPNRSWNEPIPNPKK